MNDISPISAMRYQLSNDYSISRIIKGAWQLSSGHTIDRSIDIESAVDDTLAFIREGITTVDFGDIYLGVEEMIGKVLKRLEKEIGSEARDKVQLHTKYVPDMQSLAIHRFEDVQAIIHRSCRRLGVEHLDLVQFHWWDYQVQGYVEAFQYLDRLRQEGYIRHLGVTNFDVDRMQEFVDSGIIPETIQLQYSVLDRRPENGMIEFCQRHSIKLLCYGTVAGGFLSEKYLNTSEPDSFDNRSLIKYRLIIDEFGSWESFQELLKVLQTVAQKHDTDISTIASSYILHQPQVAAVIVGARNRSHLEHNLQILKVALNGEDIRAIEQYLSDKPGPRGDIYDLERNDPRHAGIMHKNNNTQGGNQ